MTLSVLYRKQSPDWTGNKYNARAEKDDDKDMNDPDKEAETMDLPMIIKRMYLHN